MPKFILFLVLCYISENSLKAETYCRDATIPANIDAKLYGYEGLLCIRSQCQRKILDLLAINDREISVLYHKAKTSGNVANLLNKVSAIEVYSTLSVRDASFKCRNQIEVLIFGVADRIVEVANADTFNQAYVQANKLNKIVLNANNEIYVILSELEMGKISIQAATAQKLTNLIQCKNCGNVTKIIERVQFTSIFLRHSIEAEAIIRTTKYDQTILDALIN